MKRNIVKRLAGKDNGVSGLILKNERRYPIDQVASCKNSFSPKAMWCLDMNKEGTCCFKQLCIFPFSHPVCLGLWAQEDW